MPKLNGMLKKYLNKLMFCGRVLVVVVALVSLCLSGAEAAQRIFAAPDKTDKDAPSQPETNELVPGVQPEAAPDGMADVGRPWTEPDALIQAPMLLASNHSQLKSQPLALRSSAVSAQPTVCGTNSCLPATSCLVSWALGRQFTLVGAKPSGTS